MFQAGRGRAGRWTAVLVGSLAAHLVALSALGFLPRTSATWESNEIDVSFAVADPKPEVAPTEPEPVEPSQPEIALPIAALQRRRPKATTDRSARKKPSATAPSSSETEVMVALDPTSVARAFLISQEATTSNSSEAAQEGSRPAEAETGPRNYFEGVGAKQHLSVRDPPKLRLHRDGTHHYQGHAFKAIVETDGSVTFDDGYSQGVTVRFDITELMMRRRGEDPYRVEKNWFLDGTSEFRQELFERGRAKQTLVALRKLRIRLLRISEDEALSGGQKADRVIAMFVDTADDETGASAREAIAAFVADRMPEVGLPSDAQ